ncbi:MAG: hypothetical protein QOH08_144 [Chloroflexota bacterium]|nr:hypothetical protein [Chloroflexota bacterium]MEA2660572.1 hypothetical protein [Chloroflexota bacterium]
MGPRRAALGLLLAGLLACCQPGAAGPAATGVSQATQAAGQGEPVGLDGTLTITRDATNGSGGSTTESHYAISVTVHLVAKDGGPGFIDAGSTYSLIGTESSNDPQTTSQCGLHTEATNGGSGSFASPGLIVGHYGSNSPTVTLGIHAPYTSDSTGTFLCNGQTISGPSDLVEVPSCGDPSGGHVVGTIEPGNVMVPAPGQTVDFACSESFAIGNGATVVKGMLTSR